MKTHIDELRIRASGLTREQGLRLGRMVAEHLSNAPIGEAGPRHIPALSVRVHSQSTNSIGLLAASIADSIRRKF
jgi:hypothetical protein